MSLLIPEIVKQYWLAAGPTKSMPTGWISGNGVCCVHQGNRPDRRKRGGLLITDQSVSYHCFNCAYTASWHPGVQLSEKFKKLLTWLHVPDDVITQCVFSAFNLKNQDYTGTLPNLAPTFFNKDLPPGARLIKDWAADPPDRLAAILEYLIRRGLNTDDYPWYWSDRSGWSHRLIIPYYYQGRIVGFTARMIGEGPNKYISESQPGYLFNIDRQTYDRQFVVVCEGQIDAICVDGVAYMGNHISAQQQHQINRLQREVIVVPDRDTTGQMIIDQAVENEWAVSMPDWHAGIKDINDAVLRYGRLYTLWSIYHAREYSRLKIKHKLKNWIKNGH